MHHLRVWYIYWRLITRKAHDRNRWNDIIERLWKPVSLNGGYRRNFEEPEISSWANCFWVVNRLLTDDRWCRRSFRAILRGDDDRRWIGVEAAVPPTYDVFPDFNQVHLVVVCPVQDLIVACGRPFVTCSTCSRTPGILVPFSLKWFELLIHKFLLQFQHFFASAAFSPPTAAFLSESSPLAH